MSFQRTNLPDLRAVGQAPYVVRTGEPVFAGAAGTPLQAPYASRPEASYRTMASSGSPTYVGRDVASTAKGLRLSKNTFLMTGIVVMLMLCFLPIWDAIALMESANYTWWSGTSVPLTMIVGAVLTFVLFTFMSEAFFDLWRSRDTIESTQTLAMVVSVFITLLGLLLVLTSLPLSSRSIEAYNDLMYQCRNSQLTRETWVAYQELLALRQQPTCASMYSIEECPGFQATEYSNYLKDLEDNFRCSGFCYGEPQSASQAAPAASSQQAVNSTEPAASGTSLLSMSSSVQQNHGHVRESPSVESPEVSQRGNTSDLASLLTMNATNLMNYGDAYPPTLFSNANFKVSCDGAAARNMLTWSRDIGCQWWYLGISLISISVLTGLYEWTKAVY